MKQMTDTQLEQTTDATIDFAPASRTAIIGRVITPLYHEVLAFCAEKEDRLDDFMDAALQRELDHRQNEKRYSIASILAEPKQKS